MNAGLLIFMAAFLGLIGYSGYYFYKQRAYRVLAAFTMTGAAAAVYFKGITDAKVAQGGGIGVEGLFMAFTVMVLFVLDGIIAQYLSIALKKPLSKVSRLALSIGGIFVILSSLSMLLRAL